MEIIDSTGEVACDWVMPEGQKTGNRLAYAASQLLGGETVLLRARIKVPSASLPRETKLGSAVRQAAAMAGLNCAVGNGFDRAPQSKVHPPGFSDSERPQTFE